MKIKVLKLFLKTPNNTHMRYLFSVLFVFCCFIFNGQDVQDDFEGSGTITSWAGDDCIINTSLSNPFSQGINTSNTVLEYHDTGGQFANVRFDISGTFDFSVKNTFHLKVYIPSAGLTGSQVNQISLKLQDGTLAQPWSTQSEIIKPITLDQWQEVSFNFEADNFINLDGNSLPPTQRTDFNRVVIQINGEDNFDHVLAYIDDFLFLESNNVNPIFDSLVWSDEFDYNGGIDNTKWFAQTQLIAGDSWANGELQHYTSRTDNAFVDNGSLKILAKAETYNDQGVTKNYTSARLNSKFAFKYGRIEVRAKLPSIAGTWPAIWLLGKNINEDGAYWDNEGFGTTPWPFCGEIDIMEPNVSKTQILGTWHWNDGSGYMINSSSIATSNADTSQNYHLYALEWDETVMKIFMDGILINQQNTINPFNEEFYILLNVATGGNLGGAIDPSFSQDIMEIDYIRVYQESPLSIGEVSKSKSLQIFPNPTDNLLNIRSSSQNVSFSSIYITDIAGRLVYHKDLKTSSNTYSLDTLLFKNGLYFLTVTLNNNKPETIKFIKH